MATSKTTGRGKKTTESIQVVEVQQGVIDAAIIGRSPLICNAFSEKARQQLLFPPKKKNMAERSGTLKHAIYDEYRNSIYPLVDESAPTLIAMKAICFKGALRNVAVDIPGYSKAQVGRHCYIEGEYIPIYGVPKFLMAPVRQSDINRTPDIRSRAILPRWACKISIVFIEPLMKRGDVVRLMANGGLIMGVGDWRNEKGSGSYGQFRLVDPEDPEYLHIINTGGRDVQVRAMDEPEDYDEDTRRLRAWYDQELVRREMKSIDKKGK